MDPPPSPTLSRAGLSHVDFIDPLWRFVRAELRRSVGAAGRSPLLRTNRTYQASHTPSKDGRPAGRPYTNFGVLAAPACKKIRLR
jgi:hypothetical protein